MSQGTRARHLARAVLAVGLLLATACSRGTTPTPPATNVLATPLVSAPNLAAATAAARAAVPTPLLAPPRGSVGGVTGTITLFAATSLTDVLTALGTAFATDNPSAHLIFVFANSSTLAGELEQGAKADVFASAHPATMARVGAIIGSIETLARTSLTVITPADNPAHITGVQDLANPGVRVVVADSSDAVAKYTEAMLQKASADPAYGADFPTRVQRNVVSQKTTQRDMLMAVLLGQADAAVVYTSDLTPDRRYRLNAIALPEALTTLVTDPIAVARGDNAAGGQAFVKFALSAPGQDVVVSQGFARASS